MCSPGRQFAVNEIKLMLAFTILRYDVKTSDGKRPEDFKMNWFLMPNQKAELVFRRRKM